MYQLSTLTALKKLIWERGDTQATLARALGMHRTRFNAKLSERNGEVFTVRDMEAIAKYYNLPPEQREAIFFGRP